MRRPSDTSQKSQMMILHRQGNEGFAGKCDSLLFKRVGRPFRTLPHAARRTSDERHSN